MSYTFRRNRPGPFLVIAFVLGVLALIAAIVVGEAFLFHYAYGLLGLENGQAWGAAILTMFVLGALQSRVVRVVKS